MPPITTDPAASPAATHQPRWARLRQGAGTADHHNYVLAVIIGVLIVFSLDTELLSIIPMLKDIESTYHLSPVQGAWALSATGITAGATIPLLSRLGDIFGLRRLLLITLAIVAAGNIICALANGPAIFIAGRAIIGINAGLPIYYAILRARSHSKQVADRYAGLLTLAIGCALTLSFFYGGIIIQAGGTVRLALWIVAGVSLVVIAAVWLLVEEVPTRTRVGVDYLGALLIAAAFASLVTGIGQGNSWGWGSARVLGLITASVLLVAAWGAWELRTAHPLIDLRVLKRRDMWPGFTAAAMASVIGVNGLLVVTNYVQTPHLAGYGFGASVLTTGLYLVPLGVLIAFGGSVMARIIERVGQRTTVLAGGVLTVVLFAVATRASTKADFFIMTGVLGLCYALIYTGGVTVYLRAARPGEQGMITGSARAAATAIGAIGPAIITALLTASVIPKTHVPQEANYSHVWLVWAGLGAIVVIVGLFIRESKLDDRLVADAEMVSTAHSPQVTESSH
jgi:MFS family permease